MIKWIIVSLAVSYIMRRWIFPPVIIQVPPQAPPPPPPTPKVKVTDKIKGDYTDYEEIK
jgi:hypothetical protein